MARDTINSFSETAGENSDIAGVPILGSNRPSNLDDAERAFAAIVAKAVNGTTPVNATWKWRHPDQTTRTFEIDPENIPNSTHRVIDAEAAYQLALKKTEILALLTASTTFNNHLSGLTLSNNGSDATNDIDIAAGTAMDSTNAEAMTLAAALTKRLDGLWAVGTNQGGLDTGGVADGTYHVHLIKRVDTDVVDVLFSLSATAPTMPTNYTLFRRIGSIIRASSTILAFSQDGDGFLLKTAVLDHDVTIGASAVSRALTVPNGIKTTALVICRMVNASAWTGYVSSLDVNDEAPSVIANLGGAGNIADRGSFQIRTNTAKEIRARASAASTTLQIWTQGWIDTRGK